MNAEALKRQAAEAALSFVQAGEILGVGTGSTVNHFIDLLGERKLDIPGAVSSSEASSARLRKIGIEVLDLNNCGNITVYVDGADEADGHLRLIKGGGGALTREKIIAEAAQKFVCIVDASKQVELLGQFPLPVEVIPMARSLVARQLVKLGGRPELRNGFKTDNGNLILDVHDLRITDPVALEQKIEIIPGVVTCGLFARRPADLLICASAQGIKTLRP